MSYKVQDTTHSRKIRGRTSRLGFRKESLHRLMLQVAEARILSRKQELMMPMMQLRLTWSMESMFRSVMVVFRSVVEEESLSAVPPLHRRLRSDLDLLLSPGSGGVSSLFFPTYSSRWLLPNILSSLGR